MTNNDNDIDIDTPEDDFEQDSGGPKASFKESWDNNPLMKIGAVVLGAAVLFGGYMIFAPKEEGPTGKANTNIAGTRNIKSTPGNVAEMDDDMKTRIETSNQQQADKSAKTGESFIPVPIDSATSNQISVPQPPKQAEEDPLAAWRQAAADRTNMDITNAPNQDAVIEKEPETVPMVQPVRPQQAAMKMDPAVAKALAEQMRVIIAAQAPQISKVKSVTKKESEYEIMVDEEKKIAAAGGSMGSVAMPGGAIPGMSGVAAGGPAPAMATNAAAAGKQDPRLITPAGSIAYAQLLNELNSDIPGPVLAHVLSGPFAGGRALGGYKVEEEYLVLEFSVIVKQGVGYAIDGIALDEKTTLAGLKTDIDRHYFRRVILPAAAKFLEGYAAAAAQTVTSTTTTAGGGVVQTEEELDTEKELMKGVEEAAGEVSAVLTEEADRPITIKLAKGTTFGILMLKTVTTDEVGLKVGVSAGN